MHVKRSFATTLLVLAVPLLTVATADAAQTFFKVVPLVSNQKGQAKFTDPDLINAWGLAQGPGSAPVWVADTGTGLSTVYDQKSGKNAGIVVTIPGGSPTGIAYVPPNSGFQVTENGTSGDADFLFDSLSGMISGWSPSVDEANAVVAYDGSAQGDVFTGLALDTSTGFLFAADIANNKVDVFDNKFNLKSSFTDSSLPAGYAPYNVAIFNGDVYVTFTGGAGAGADSRTPKGGPGYVDIFDESGKLLKHLIKQGPLDAPWGMAMAPSSFGSFAGSLLVGNLDDGMINAFDPSSGKFLGALSTKNGAPIVINGLWALDAVPKGDITFSAGPQGYANGLLGLIEVNK
ncbi:MAG TPA: TIGR03118 family protein [Rhizomicrobium sp.]|jgi:uncharacterized protein (TIGR03118 family)|nr:TIGR03118 family protein [Rhizomicrobium sp.]